MAEHRTRPLRWVPAMVLVFACGSATPPPETPMVATSPVPPTPAAGPMPTNITYLEDAELYSPDGTAVVPAVTMDRYLPSDAMGATVVVVVHGGDADGSSMAAIAAAMAERGAIVYTPTYLESGWPSLEQVRAGESRPDKAIGDVACAVRVANEDATSLGANGDGFILVGFSRGAQIGAVLALAGDTPWPDSGRCTSTAHPRPLKVFVGLDGPYDWESFAAATEPELWEATDKQLMATISPVTHATGPGDDVAFRLISGGQATADGSFQQHAEVLAAALTSAGYSASTLHLSHVFHTGFQYPGVIPEVIDLISATWGDRA